MFLTSGMLATLSYPFLKKKISPKKNLARCWPQEYQSLLLTTKEEMEASMSSLKLFCMYNKHMGGVDVLEQ